MATAAGLAVQVIQLLPVDINVALAYTEAGLRGVARNPCANCSLLIRDRLAMTWNNVRRP